MVNKELLDYIKSVKEKGVSDDAIKAHLLNYNYSQEIIDDAFKELASSTLVYKEDKKHGKKSPNLLFYFIIALLVLGVGLTVFFIFGKGTINLEGLNIDFLSPSSQCEKISLSIYKISNEPVLCVYPDNSKIQIIMENNGQENINKVEISIKGQKGSFNDELNNLNLKPNDVFPRTVLYNFALYGNLKEVTLLPIVVSENKEMRCNNNKISFTELKTC